MKLAEEYDRTQRERSESNARDFSVVADFRKGPPEGWSLDGVGLRHGWVSNGDLAVALEGSSAVEMLLPAGLFTHSLSPRLNGALRNAPAQFLRSFLHQYGGERRRLQFSPSGCGQRLPDRTAGLLKESPTGMGTPVDDGRPQKEPCADHQREGDAASLCRAGHEDLEPELPFPGRFGLYQGTGEGRWLRVRRSQELVRHHACHLT